MAAKGQVMVTAAMEALVARAASTTVQAAAGGGRADMEARVEREADWVEAE